MITATIFLQLLSAALLGFCWIMYLDNFWGMINDSLAFALTYLATGVFAVCWFLIGLKRFQRWRAGESVAAGREPIAELIMAIGIALTIIGGVQIAGAFASVFGGGFGRMRFHIPSFF